MALEPVSVGDNHVAAHNLERDAINELLTTVEGLGGGVEIVTGTQGHRWTTDITTSGVFDGMNYGIPISFAWLSDEGDRDDVDLIEYTFEDGMEGLENSFTAGVLHIKTAGIYSFNFEFGINLTQQPWASDGYGMLAIIPDGVTDLAEATYYRAFDFTDNGGVYGIGVQVPFLPIAADSKLVIMFYASDPSDGTTVAVDWGSGSVDLVPLLVSSGGSGGGGSAPVEQDTGWRWLSAGYVPSVPTWSMAVRRQGDRVYVRPRADDNHANLSNVWSIPEAVPEGFRPSGVNGTIYCVSFPCWLEDENDGFVIDQLQFGENGNIGSGNVPIRNIGYNFPEFSFLTDDPWPTSLPGVPDPQ